MEPYIGEIKIFAGNFAPRGWAFCNGQLLPISTNTALFSILGTIYGGDGRTTFALPDLQGRVPVHQGMGPGLTGRQIGEAGGELTVALSVNQMPLHKHQAQAQETPNATSPENAVWSKTTGRGSPDIYADEPDDTLMNTQALQISGDSQAHNNMQPYLGLNFIIALEGVFPPRS